MKRKLEDEYLTPATDKREITIQTDDTFPNQKSIPGDSVDKHKNLEVANAIVGEGEVKQQNENL